MCFFICNKYYIIQVNIGDNMKSEIYSYENKVSLDKCNQMLDILVSFYNDLNGKENNTKEMRDTWINN